MADFTPDLQRANLQGYTGQGAFRFWCQMSLPIVYDDSLSYYELLNKVVVYLNNTISDVATAETNIENINDTVEHNMDALLTAYNLLQGYVNDYFDNLDVQEEINNKLDEMASSGALSNLLAPLIPDLVTNWLTAHVNPVGSAVVVDNSLTVSGAAADAKITGQRISTNKTAIENNFADNRATSIDKSLLVGDFVNGAIRESDGGLITNDYSYRVASSEYFVFSTDIVLYIANGFNARVAFYNSNDELTGKSDLLYNIPFGIAKNTKFRITIKRDVENTAETANISEFRSAVTYLTNTTKSAITTENEFNKICDCTNAILPPQNTFVDNTALDNNGGITNFNGWYTSIDFVKIPDYCDSFRTAYDGSTGYIGVYTAPTADSFIARFKLLTGKLDVSDLSGKYVRFSFQGTVSNDYSKITILSNDPLHRECESIKNDVTGATINRIGIITKPTIKQHGDVIATTNDLAQGDVLYYRFTATRVGYLSVKDFNNETITNIGLTTPDETAINAVYEGSYTIPAKFDRIVVSSNVNITKFEKQSISTDIKNAVDNNNTSNGYINGTVNTETGELFTRTHLRRIVKKQIEFTNHAISVNVVDRDYYVAAFFYDESGNMTEYSNWSYHCVIPANSYYRVGIRKVTEDNQLADIATFASAVNFQNNILIDYPLTYMPSYMIGAMSYCPLGKLSKPYICFSTDDGRHELSTYTVPMFIQKNVPLTMCIWSTSQVMTDSAEKAQIIAAITSPTTAKYTSGPNAGQVINAGYSHSKKFEVAQHGNDPWADGSVKNTPFDEKTLFDFWESEKAAFAAQGITVAKSAAYPYGYTNQLVVAMSGGYFGVNRSVYNPTDRYLVTYPDFCLGERSNIYALRAANINYYNLEKWQRIIDYTIAHNTLLCIYFHDWDLNADQKSVLEAVIDYAKNHTITFCNLSDIPNLV